jgi:hypothetical protein
LAAGPARKPASFSAAGFIQLDLGQPSAPPGC